MATNESRHSPSTGLARRHRSFRLAPGTLLKLEQRARDTATSQATLAERYLDEGLRRDAHPAIVFVDEPAGRRPRIAGTGLDVWEVVETFRNSDNSIEETATYLAVSPRLVREAMRYYAEFAVEIDAWTQRMHEISDQELEAEQRLRAVLE